MVEAVPSLDEFRSLLGAAPPPVTTGPPPAGPEAAVPSLQDFQRLLREPGGPGTFVSGGRVYSEFGGADITPAAPFDPFSIGKRMSALHDVEKQGVDTAAGGNAWLRAQLSFTPSERQATFLDQSVGAGKWRHTDAGIVLRTDRGEVLLDEAQFTLRDLADLTGDAAGMAAGIGGALAAAMTFPFLAAGGVLSLAALATVAAVSEFAGRSALDVMQELRTGGVTGKDIENIAKTRGVGAAVNALLGSLGAAGFRLTGAVAQFFAGPFAPAMRTPVANQITQAADALGVRTTPGMATQHPTLLAAESLLGKMPGSRGPFADVRAQITDRISAIRERLIGGAPTAAAVGEAVADEMTTQNATALASIAALRNQATTILRSDLDRMATAMNSKAVSLPEAGEMGRDALAVARGQFDGKQSALAGHTQSLIDELPLEAHAFAFPTNTQATAQEIIDQLPKNVLVELKETGLVDQYGRPFMVPKTTTTPVVEFLPSGMMRYIGGARKLPDNMTVRELRDTRALVNLAITEGDALGNVSTGLLKKFAAGLTADIRAAIDNAPTPEIGAALSAEISHYRDVGEVFRNRIVSRALRSVDAPGFMESADLLPGLIRGDKFEDAGRILAIIGPQSAAAQAARRAVFDDMTRDAKSAGFGTGTIDSIQLGRQIERLSPETQTILFGSPAETKAALDTLRAMGAASGKLDINTLAAGNQSALSLLRIAATQELEAKANYENNIVKGIIRNPAGITQLNPDEFVRWSMTSGSNSDVQALWSLMSPPLRESVKQRVIVDLLDRSAALSGQEIRTVMVGKEPIGQTLLETMATAYGFGNRAASMARLQFVLGKDTVEALTQLGTVESAWKAQEVGAAAVGGMARSSILAKFADIKFGEAITLMKYRIVAGLMTSDATRKWLTSGVTLPTAGARMRSLVVNTPQILNVLVPLIGEAAADKSIQELLEMVGD